MENVILIIKKKQFWEDLRFKKKKISASYSQESKDAGRLHDVGV